MSSASPRRLHVVGSRDDEDGSLRNLAALVGGDQPTLARPCRQ